MSVTPTPRYRSHAFQKRYLKFTALVVGAFGPVFFLGSMLPTAEPARWTLDLLSWPLDGAQSYAAETTRFLSALTGGFLLGWGVTIWGMSGRLFDAAPELVRRVVLSGILSWFVLDSTGSAASGNTPNVVFNTLILLLAVGPLWWRAEY
ncbi:hypothetical protein [Phaeodactylibacter sp.]|uniref:hypothetical protein n=1 Tax=Phaeodactylibacter sp. TaxID=1940289 RepID=UPI0025D7262B|nr:hypothetical protein [Phaeodactylibacter sp.]MCI4647908.1 hypothetical protein [Phaeodactylibacter sp.]MCI5092399.1 hypothetical protein [Phaeodactylibacter sp.]